VGTGGLDGLGQPDGNAVARLDAQAGQHVGQAVGGLGQLGAAVVARRRVGAVGDQGRRLGRGRIVGPAAAADLGHVETGWHLPAEIGVQAGVEVDGLVSAWTAGHGVSP